MSAWIIALQIIIAAGILNVWLLRQNQSTPWRPAGALNMREEFRAYGYPEGMWKVIGALKITFAVCLIAGIWYPPLALIGGVGMAALMTGAVLSHFRVHDPLRKSLPSATLLVLSLLVVAGNVA